MKATIISALNSGKSVRLNEWEKQTRMFVLEGELVCQRGYAQPYRYDLSWHELTAEFQIV
jgi:hypothetical protein